MELRADIHDKLTEIIRLETQVGGRYTPLTRISCDESFLIDDTPLKKGIKFTPKNITLKGWAKKYGMEMSDELSVLKIENDIHSVVATDWYGLWPLKWIRSESFRVQRLMCEVLKKFDEIGFVTPMDTQEKGQIEWFEQLMEDGDFDSDDERTAKTEIREYRKFERFVSGTRRRKIMFEMKPENELEKLIFKLLDKLNLIIELYPTGPTIAVQFDDDDFTDGHSLSGYVVDIDTMLFHYMDESLSENTGNSSFSGFIFGSDDIVLKNLYDDVFKLVKEIDGTATQSDGNSHP